MAPRCQVFNFIFIKDVQLVSSVRAIDSEFVSNECIAQQCIGLAYCFFFIPRRWTQIGSSWNRNSNWTNKPVPSNLHPPAKHTPHPAPASAGIIIQIFSSFYHQVPSWPSIYQHWQEVWEGLGLNLRWEETSARWDQISIEPRHGSDWQMRQQTDTITRLLRHHCREHWR